MIPGVLNLTLADPQALSSVMGSSYDDTIIGNANNDTLIGGGGLNEIVGGTGNDFIEGGFTRVVYLDFTTYELPGQHVYTAMEESEILAQIEADYADFAYTFTLTQPESGPYTAITFNDPALVGLEGGIATEIDWRNLDIDGTTTLTADGLVVVPPDSAGVNVNNLLAARVSRPRPAPTSWVSRRRLPRTSWDISPACSTWIRLVRSGRGFTRASTPLYTTHRIPGRPTPTRR